MFMELMCGSDKFIPFNYVGICSLSLATKIYLIYDQNLHRQYLINYSRALFGKYKVPTGLSLNDLSGLS